MYSLTEATAIFGLLLLTGGCWLQCLYGVSDDQQIKLLDRAAKRSTSALAIGFFLLVAGSIAQGHDVFFTAGQTLLAGIVAAATIIDIRKNLTAFRSLAIVGSLVLVVLQTMTSHSMQEPGWLPAISHFVHAAAAVIWGGALLHLLLRITLLNNTKNIRVSPARLVRRYAILSLGLIVVLGFTGGILAFVHIHDSGAMNTSIYGAAFKLKSAAALVLLLTISINCLRFTPVEPKASDAESPKKLSLTPRRVLATEASLLLIMILATGILAARQPVGIAPFLNPQSWIMKDDSGDIRVSLQPVSGRAGNARFEITAEPPDAHFPDGTLARFAVAEANGTAGQSDIDAIPIGPAAFLGEAVLAVPGDWQFELTLDPPNGEVQHLTHGFTLPEPPLRQDMHASLGVVTIVYSRVNKITFGVGLLLILIAAWSVRLTMQKRAPTWMMPASLLNAVLGGYLILSVAFVKTYPSSFWPNPEPFTAAVIRAGEPLYQAQCANCHGVSGRGDGAWAVENRGSIPDLTAPHIDSHTDGEIYWWIRYGIPSLEMPPRGDELSEREIWTVIHFIRALRHGTPPEY